MRERHGKRRLGEILLAQGVITDGELEDALAEQSTGGRRERLGATIIRLGMAEEADIAHALASQLGLGTVDLAKVGAESAALSRVPRKLAERHHILPLAIDENDILVVAMADPTNVVALDDIKLTSGLRGTRAVVTTQSSIDAALRRLYGADQEALDVVEGLENDVQTIDEDEDLNAAADASDDQPIIRLANAILSDAVRGRASDVHVEPERDRVRVRYRIDGMLREAMRVPRHIGPALTSRLKIMSNLDIAERRRPQDGRAMIRVEGQEVDLRVSTMPTMYGEVMVLRLLRKGTERLKIDDLGLAPDLRETFETALSRPQGLIVMTGPTGSGKTTSLYAGLATLADPVRNIITLEDPVEYQLAGVNQTQINPKVDLTFARGLRTVLRQDPDVVMVGEIRDRETAELAMEASFTGHLVLSTLHTNDAPSTIVRMVDLGVERFLIASSLLLVVAQRLARVVCPHCKEPTEPDERTLKHLNLTREDLAGVELVKGAGCQFCERNGYFGRIGLMSMLRVTPQMRELITDGASETEIARLARKQGMRSLREDGLLKAFAGITTLEEVLRTTPDEALGEETVAIDTSLAEGIQPYSGKSHDEDTALPRSSNDGDAGERSVLVVDDDPSVRQLLGTMLMDDFTVFEAATGEAAIELARQHRPDVIVLDFRLPDTDGVEVTRLLRADARTNDLPIVMITGHPDAAVEVEGLVAGIDDYVTKPFDGDVLQARIAAAARRQQTR